MRVSIFFRLRSGTYGCSNTGTIATTPCPLGMCCLSAQQVILPLSSALSLFSSPCQDFIMTSDEITSQTQASLFGIVWFRVVEQHTRTDTQDHDRTQQTDSLIRAISNAVCVCVCVCVCFRCRELLHGRRNRFHDLHKQYNGCIVLPCWFVFIFPSLVFVFWLR